MMARDEKSGLSAFLRMVLSTKGNGSLMRIRRIEEVFKSGLMVLDMMASGKMEWPMAMADSSTPKVMCMRVSGWRTRPTGKVSTPTLTEADMKVSGIKTNSMESALNNGQMVPSTKDITNQV